MRDDVFDKLSDEQLKQQILVLLGYAPDTIQVDEASFAHCFANFFNIFKVDNDRTFNISQRNSLDCILGKKTYLECLNSLTAGNKKSFIIAPLSTAPYVSFSVIYKSKDAKSFNCIVINKQNNEPRSYIQYTIACDDIKNLVDCLGYTSMQFITIDRFLSVFQRYAYKSSELDYNCRLTNANSKTNYILEMEAAFNLAYSRAFLFKYFAANKSINTKSNWDISLQKSNHFNIVGPFEPLEIHDRFLDNIKSKHPNLSSDIDELVSIKEKNDKLYLEFSQNTDFSVSEFFFKLAFNYDETHDFAYYIKDIDMRNLAQNFDFIYHLCNEHNLDKHISALNILKPILGDKNADLSDFLDNIDTLETLFPAAVFELCAIHSNEYLIQALDHYNCAMNMINDMLNIAQTVNEHLISVDITDDNYSDDYYTPYNDKQFEYPSIIVSSDNSSKSDVSTNNQIPPYSDDTTSLDDNKSEYPNSPDISFKSDDNLNEITNDEEYYTPYEATTHDYPNTNTSDKYTIHSYNPNSVNFSNIYNMDNTSTSESNIDIDDYLNSDTFKTNVITTLAESFATSSIALAMDPNNALCHYILGVSALYLGKSEAAQIEFKEACDLIPTNTNFKVFEAVSLILNNNIEDAILQIKSALEINPNNEDAKNLSSLLSSSKNPDEIRDLVIDSYRLDYMDISLELSAIINSAISIDHASLYSTNKFSYIPTIISDTVSTVSDIPSSNLVRSYSSLNALDKYAKDILGSNFTRSISLLESITESASDNLNKKLTHSYTSFDGLNKLNSNQNLFRSRSISYLSNIDSSVKDNHDNLHKKSKEYNNTINHERFDI